MDKKAQSYSGINYCQVDSVSFNSFKRYKADNKLPTDWKAGHINRNNRCPPEDTSQILLSM
jgi:hypothetical protein